MSGTDPERLLEQAGVDELPHVTADLPGTGGRIKDEPSRFVVEEVDLYEPCGEGGHVYVRLTRDGWTTRAVQRRLAEVFGVAAMDVGCAGLKDKVARVTQTFSLPLPTGIAVEEVERRLAGESSFAIDAVHRHGNKLRTGHLLGNRFRIVVDDVTADAEDRARAVLDAVARRGLPNFFGAQRFGGDGENVFAGRRALFGRGPRQRWLRRLVLSAWQSAVFNIWLAERLRDSLFGRALEGDVAKKTATGGLFDVDDAAIEQPRLDAREITVTGPLFGHRMRSAAGVPGERERELLARTEIDVARLRRARLEGTRRAARVDLGTVELERHDAALVLAFFLPKGSYATTLLREITKS